MAQAKEDHQQIVVRLENELREAKGVEKEKEELLERLQKLEKDLEEKVSPLHSGPAPVYDDNTD